jgi:Cu(I)/Ag(I) efflux system membrane protein CusA/SilA
MMAADDRDLPLASREDGWIGKGIAFCLKNRLVMLLALLGVILWGLMTAPFDWPLGGLPRDPVPVDAIPDIGENQQIVFTEWPGRSPRDIEDQITYPLSSALLGMPGVKAIRSYSMFGFSSVYVVFGDEVDFYWSRTRILEKLNSLPKNTLPDGIKPTLGPDATPLGQIFWYTLEGRDENGRPTGGWDLHELRSIQDWIVRYELMAAPGVSEVASAGGFVQEYQVDVDPDALRAHGATLQQIVKALQRSNQDIGARTLEINRVEYVIRGLGFVKEIADLESAVVKVTDHVPIRVKDVARVNLGPALRRGALDKSGAEAVGGVVVVRYGENPLEVIQAVKERIREFSASLPTKEVEVRRQDGSFERVTSRVTLVPFYDRTGLIHETLGTLYRALSQEILVTIIVVVILLMNLKSSLLISGLLPLAVLMCFIAMKVFGVDANIVALSGIAIAIGTMVDMGIVLNENILRRLERADKEESALRVVYRASVEVGGAVLTAVATTVISFLPVFAMEAAEGKLFKPLAYTKTFALIASLLVALTLIPPATYLLFRPRTPRRTSRFIIPVIILAGGLIAWKVTGSFMLFLFHLVLALFVLVRTSLAEGTQNKVRVAINIFAVLLVAWILTRNWMPLGLGLGMAPNLVFVIGALGGVLLLIFLFLKAYPAMLTWCLGHKLYFLSIPAFLCLWGATVWLGFDRMFAFIPAGARLVGMEEKTVRHASPWVWASHAFPGLGKEFMPALDEGSFLLMPTTMPHASIGEAMDVLRKQDMAITAIPEVEVAVGKIGRVDSSLDPAPVSMIETVINYKQEYLSDREGRPLLFRFDENKPDFFRDPDGRPMYAPDGKPYKVKGKFLREKGWLVQDDDGEPFRLWRPALDPALNPDRSAWPGIQRPEDIWDEILRVTELPGTTSAPMLQPISARIVMLQSGMRAPMGVKVLGKGRVTLEELERTGIEIERFLKEVPSVKAAAVSAERIVGKPYLEFAIDREAIARYGVNVVDVQSVIQTAVGGMAVTTTVEGRERYDVLVRYKRELRDSIESLERVIIAGADGTQIPLRELILGRGVTYRRGPQMIKSENGALVSYVLLDKEPGFAEVEVVNQADRYLQDKIASGELVLPPGVTYRFAGSFENQVRSEKKLKVVLPLALFLIFVILYLQFRSGLTSLLVFSGILVAWSGGFILLWLYGQEWFFDFEIFGTNLRDLFQMGTINLSVAVWVGFIALFGIATDDGVIMATYLRQSFRKRQPESVQAIRDAAHAGAMRRIRPCLMTTATTILALLPVMTSTGRGAEIMVPMAIPSFGGMLVALITAFVVPTLYCAIEEVRFRIKKTA